MKIDGQLAQRFVCPKCRSAGAAVKRLAATGTGLSHIFDIEHKVFIAASCCNCGEGKDDVGAVLVLIFG